MSAQSIKPTHKSIAAYHETLAKYAAHGADHEGALETAFSNLLASTANTAGWTLIPKQPLKLGGGKTIFPDGTLRDLFNLPRGYWEAKDTNDDLDDEIQKKIKSKYPLGNTIFEDTREAVLFQDRKEHLRYDLTNPQEVADLLNQFFAYVEPNIEGFEQAVDEFKERVPELAKGLDEKIKKAHTDNKKFQQAFGEFFELCQTALNPKIRREAVDEMLIQHLLTERLFRSIFDDDEFTRRNVIAAEVEKVIVALFSKSFGRDDFLRSLDKFYKAIALAADTIDSLSDKLKDDGCAINCRYEQYNKHVANVAPRSRYGQFTKEWLSQAIECKRIVQQM